MITDEQLTAWLDGELPADEAMALQRRLEAEPELAARLEALDLDKSALVDGFASLVHMAPRYVQDNVAQSGLARLARPAAVAALIGLAMGAGYGLGSRPKIGDWRMEVAHYQILYVPETLTGLQPDQPRLASEFAVAQARVGRPLDHEALSRVDGLTLRRAQVLGFRGQPLIQIAYTAPDGTPIAFCIIRNQDRQTIPPRDASLLGLASESWQDAAHTYLVIGGDDPENIARYAQQIRRQL